MDLSRHSSMSQSVEHPIQPSGDIEGLLPLPSGDSIAAAVLEQFEKLPSKFKPVQRTPTVREWTVLSGIVLSLPEDFVSSDTKKLRCVALGLVN
jgi:hypothetical protein